jgi:hypothetical protein
MAVGFAQTIKPYFTQLDRDKMLDGDHTGGFTLDLWSASDCQQNWASINRVVAQGRMPPKGNPPDTDGPWSPEKKAQFAKDFQAWKDSGFQP